MINWKLITIPIKDLKAHSKNPRQINKQQQQKLEELIKKYGLIDKPIVNLDNVIIGGHQRVKILKKLKVKQVECWVPDHELSQEEIDHLCIGLNLNQGAWDYDILANEWDPIDLLNYGFTEEQLLGVSKEAETLNDEEDELLEPAKDEDAITKLGDVYELDGHIVICGDSTNPEVISRAIKDAQVEMVYTDPPYGISVNISDGKKHGNAKAKRNKFSPIANDDSNQTAIDAFNYCQSLEIPIMIWWGANYYTSCLPESSCWIVWDKDTSTNNFPDVELAWCNSKSPVRIFKHTWNGMIKASESGERRVHPTQKPVALAKWCLEKYGEGCRNVLDLFLGSGSTLIAAESLHRKCIGVELSPAYVDIIVNRWIKYRQKNGLNAIIKRNGELISHHEVIK